MATQKPGEWANSLLARFEDQVSKNLQKLIKSTKKQIKNHGKMLKTRLKLTYIMQNHRK